MKKSFVLLLLVGILFGFSGGVVFAAPTCSVKAQISPKDQTVNEGSLVGGIWTPTSVQLNGESSKDESTYFWTQSSTDPFSVTLSDPHAAKPAFTAPEVGPSGADLNFTLTVTGCSPIQTDSISTTIHIVNVEHNLPPTANFTITPNPANEGTTVTLDANGSSDPNGDSLTYTWSQTAGTLVVLSSSSDKVLTFTAPSVPYPNGETLTFKLVVSDGSVSDNISNSVSIKWVNDPPVAILQCPTQVDERSSVTLTSLSTDSDGDGMATYEWSQVLGIPNADLTGVPVNGSTLNFTAPSLTSATFHTMIFDLKVTDNGALYDSNECSILVLDVTPPVIDCDKPDGVWHKDDVSIKCTAKDLGSDLADPTADANFFLTTSVPSGTEDSNASTGSRVVYDNANPQNPATAGPIAGNMVDKKAPNVSCTGPNPSIWYDNNQSMSCDVTDSGSGPAKSPIIISTNIPDGAETNNAPTNSDSACDNVGNCKPIDAYVYMIDRKAPVVYCGSSDSIWHNTNQSVSCTATDGGSGLKNSADASFSLSTSVSAGNETDSASTGSRSVSDIVGHITNTGPFTFKIDMKPPQLSSCDSPDGQWHGSDVTLYCSYTDGGSGPANQNVPLSTSVGAGAETNNAVGSANGAKACDNVCNCANSPSDIAGNKIDKKAPQLSSCQQPDGAWHATDVTLKCIYTDGGSGPLSQDISLSTNIAANTETNNATASAGGAKACDAMNNCATSPLDISGNKIDKKPPTNITFSGIADSGSYYFGFVPTTTCTAEDGGSGVKSCVVSDSDSSGKVGPHTPTATATDNVGNQSTKTISYTVLAWTLKGFYQPVDMPNPNIIYNTVKGGSTVPLKFEIFAGPTELTDTSYVKPITFAPTNCDASATSADVEVTATGGTSLRYDLTGGQFIYNWKTPTGAGQCYRVTMTTIDGSRLAAFFKMK